MHNHTHSPSAPVERPYLVDFLIVIEDQKLDIGLRLWMGAIEVGLIGISAGRVVFAELPGATGDAALRLLASLTGARLAPESWTTRGSNVDLQWRGLVDEHESVGPAVRKERLAAARDALKDWISSDFGGSEDEAPNGRAQRVVLDLLDWCSVVAYLDGDLDRTEELLVRRRSLGPDTSICSANLERLRLRRLDGEFDSTQPREPR